MQIKVGVRCYMKPFAQYFAAKFGVYESYIGRNWKYSKKNQLKIAQLH